MAPLFHDKELVLILVVQMTTFVLSLVAASWYIDKRITELLNAEKKYLLKQADLANLFAGTTKH